MGRGALEGFSVAVLLKHFLAPVAPGQADAYEHVATVLPNVTRIAAGRKLLLQPGSATSKSLRSLDLSRCPNLGGDALDLHPRVSVCQGDSAWQQPGTLRAWHTHL